MIQVLLTKSLPKIGKRGDLKNVKDGFYRNYLLPRGIAVVPTPGRMKELDVRRSKMEARQQELKKKMKDVLQKLENTTVTLEKKASAAGKLYASVTGKQIAEALNEQGGFDFATNSVILDQPLKAVGSFVVHLRLAEDFTTPVKVEIAAAKK
jgi:large subunit ribosomal protein L9